MNFGGIPDSLTRLNKAQIVILPVPYDETSVWIKGADKGPDAIIEASVNLELYDIETDSQVYKRGIHTAAPITEMSSPGKLVNKVYEKVKSLLLKNKYIVTIGGNHTVSIGAMKAFAEEFTDLTILQLDAHADLRQRYKGSEYNHASVMARAREICPVIQVGIRSMSKGEKKYLNKERVVFAHEIHFDENWEKRVFKHLTKNVYLTLDLDVFDTSVIPSTGTPEPGGLQYYQVLFFLKKLIHHSNLAGFDVVELCPNRSNKAPDFLAAKLIYQILSYRFSKSEK
ncbi:MAG: agmatinase [Bacteroidales bacterium]|nr:MAG: agmatinase [Bacteroidales bacterium]